MCGFVGFSETSAVADRIATIRDMMNTIVHRGPDSEGWYSDDQITLGFRRLKIIDLSDSGSQPMYNEDRTKVLVFNGEIYNYKQLREELIACGHRFGSETDSEVVIHGYEQYGIDILQRLRGMFAFAIWDVREKTLFIARDIFGIKPLYYTRHTTDGSFMFGSEIKAFAKSPAFIKEINDRALKPYLTFQYSALDETFFRGVYKLPPGHYMLYREKTLEIKPYHEHRFQSEEDSLEHYVGRIRETVSESVQAHRVSDVKVGAFLSGGIDSSYITALLKPHKTFSVGFKDYEGIFNETVHAKALSDMLGIENHRVIIDADECFDRLPTIQYHMDEPQSNPSAVPLYFLSELASRHVTVVLSGEGADEIFGGYAWYSKTPAMRKYEALPYALRRPVSRICGLLPANRLTSFLVKGGQKVEERFIGQAHVFDERDAAAVLKEPYRSGPTVRSVTDPVYAQAADEDDVTKMQYLDMKLWLPGDILLKADKMSMAHSLELRVPYLDKRVMALAQKLPARYRVDGQQTKLALRKAALAELPAEWANREKVGFPVPIRFWLRQEKYYRLVREMFESEWAKRFFHTEMLVRLLDEHRAGKRNHARQIWTAYVFLVWYGVYFG